MAYVTVEIRVSTLEYIMERVCGGLLQRPITGWTYGSQRPTASSETDQRLNQYFECTEQALAELSQEVRNSTRKWGEVSNKMGKLAEDFSERVGYAFRV